MELYEIVFNGEVLPGAQVELVRDNLARLFQADEQRLALLFSGRRWVLKSNLERAEAHKYRATLERAGAQVSVVPMALDVEEIEMTALPGDGGTGQGRLEVEPRDVYMAAFSAVDAPNYDLAEPGSDLQDPPEPPQAPALDLSALSLAPPGSDLGQQVAPPAPPAPDTAHIKLV